MCAAYGAGILGHFGIPSDYLTWCQLWLHLERVELKSAVATARGVGIAGGDGDVPLAYFDAVSLTTAEAESLEMETNARRGLDVVRRRYGGGG